MTQTQRCDTATGTVVPDPATVACILDIYNYIDNTILIVSDVGARYRYALVQALPIALALHI